MTLSAACNRSGPGTVSPLPDRPPGRGSWPGAAAEQAEFRAVARPTGIAAAALLGLSDGWQGLGVLLG